MRIPQTTAKSTQYNVKPDPKGKKKLLGHCTSRKTFSMHCFSSQAPSYIPLYYGLMLSSYISIDTERNTAET